MKHLFNIIASIVREVALLPLTIYSFVGGTSKIQGLILFMIAGLIWIPLAQIQAVADPIGTYSRIAGQGIGIMRLKNDVSKAVKNVPAVRYSADKAKRYKVDLWAKNQAIVAGTYKPSIADRFVGAIMSPFRAVGVMVRGLL